MSDRHEQIDDGRLVQRTLGGDCTAFERLYDRHARRVRAVVWSAAGDPSAVDDLTQECFMRAYRKLDQLHPHEHFGPWLVGIARRVAREKRRSLHRDRHPPRRSRCFLAGNRLRSLVSVRPIKRRTPS